MALILDTGPILALLDEMTLLTPDVSHCLTTLTNLS